LANLETFKFTLGPTLTSVLPIEVLRGVNATHILNVARSAWMLRNPIGQVVNISTYR